MVVLSAKDLKPWTISRLSRIDLEDPISGWNRLPQSAAPLATDRGPRSQAGQTSRSPNSNGAHHTGSSASGTPQVSGIVGFPGRGASVEEDLLDLADFFRGAP